MTNRCDSVDALMYAYYEFMRIKEENQMLEKNKDYIEMRVSSTDCAFTQNEPTSICVDGYVYTTYMNLPDPGELYVLISKEKFEKMQAENQHYRELAKQREENYNLLLEKTGFTSESDIIDYIHDPSMTSPEDKTLKEIIEECEEDYISERDKAEALKTENEQLKKKLAEFSPAPGYREFLKALYPEATEATIEKLIWTTGQLCCGRDLPNALQTDLEYYRSISSAQAKSIYSWKEATGCSTPEEAKELINGKKKRIIELKDQVKYTCDEWYSANSRNNSWKAAAECNSPKELIEKREALEKGIRVYSRALTEWKEGTGCPSPSAAKTLIESGASWHHAYNEIKAANEKLEDDVNSWKNVTEYSTPESFLAAKINDLGNDCLSWKMVTGCSCPKDLSKKIVEWEKILTPNMSARDLCSAMSNAIESYKRIIKKWREATGCNAPEVARSRINALINEATTWESDYNHLLALTGFDNEGKIEDFLEQNHDRNKLTTVIDNLKLENETMKTALRTSNLAMQKELDHEIDAWQKATGRIDPEAAKQYIDRLKGRLNKIHGYSVDW